MLKRILRIALADRDMQYMKVTLATGDVEIDGRVFLALLDLSPIKQYKTFKKAIELECIPYTDLKSLALKADVPYPLFFAPFESVLRQIADFNSQLDNKIPSKGQLSLSTRGRLRLSDIKLLLKDLSRKQRFLSSRVVKNAPNNGFVGLVAKDVRNKVSTEVIANKIREYLEIDLDELRSRPKGQVVNYITNKLERKNVLVCSSSHTYMPQKLNGIEMSGICIKDKKFPFVFINTKDGEDDPKIIEPFGRQTFTLVAMLVCLSMNRFIFSSSKRFTKESTEKLIYDIAGELLIPKKDLVGVSVEVLDDLKVLSKKFKATPSMCLFRLRELKKIDTGLAKQLQDELLEELNDRPGRPKPPSSETGYLKYNGTRFSKEVLMAEKRGLISSEEMRNVLFRKGKKMDSDLLRRYRNKLGI